MAEGSTLVGPEPPAIDETVLTPITARITEAIGPAGSLQSCLTLLLSAVQALDLRQGEALLELDGVASHECAGTYVPVYVLKSAGTEPAV
jgi:hypothetical protein